MPEAHWQAEQIWRHEHMQPMLTLDREPPSERIGRELTDQFIGFEHNLPFAETSPLEGLRAAARVHQVADQATSRLLTVALRQQLPLRQVAEALGVDPAALQHATGYPDQPDRQ
ncbi:hypothetical protein AB0L54_34420 [Streptomyces sp. NPDC052196]|uniref:hypothetical protein n=1 Tax=Streptomyces sp. NPDC052196 TaxID=3156691 RepID=UPI003446D7EB